MVRISWLMIARNELSPHGRFRLLPCLLQRKGQLLELGEFRVVQGATGIGGDGGE